MRKYPKFPDPLEVPTFAKNSKWLVSLRPHKHIFKRISYGNGKEKFVCEDCGKTIWD